jgi:hypothetical protein
MKPFHRKKAIALAASHLAMGSGEGDLRGDRGGVAALVGKGDNYRRERAPIPASTSALQLPSCRSLFEWVDFIGELDGKVYTGVSQVGLIGSSSTPIFDNEDLQGSPIANLRGSAIVDERDLFATGTPSFYFYDDSNSLLTFLLGFSVAENGNGPEGNYGIPLGGTGEWSGFQGFIYNSRLTSRYETPYIVNYTICALQ